MAQAVDSAIAHRHHLLVEAGTGIGKTLAYLIPALMSGGKILISTGTKTLQDQLFGRDLPNVQSALKMPITTALLKGRSNYVCPYHLSQALSDKTLKRHLRNDLERIHRFALASVYGDRADCDEVADDSPAWSRAVSTRDNCLGAQCPNAEQCFVMKARKNAQNADVLVVNHHLFFADMAIRETGGQELLPTAQVLIFDEAHQVKDIATDFFSDNLSSMQLRELARDARREMMTHLPEMAEWFNLADAVEYRSADWIQASARLPEKCVAEQALNHADFALALDKLAEALEALMHLLEKVEERAAGITRIIERTQIAHWQINLWKEPSTIATDADDESNPKTVYIHWLAKNGTHLKIIRTPLSIAESMQRQYRALARSWIFCSATLSVAQDFSMTQRDLGLITKDETPTEDSSLMAEVLAVESPFDYYLQSRLYIPTHMPPPNDGDFMPKLLDEIIPAIRACAGGVFLLCTSHRAVAWFYEALSARLTQRLILSQHAMSRHRILDAFREQGNAVLVGSHSFWEGVDFPGPTLSLVIIDKLPFAPPDDPLQNAIRERIKKSGGDPFHSLQIPQAAILLKQGAGRLIRTENDSGALIIGDSRLVTKAYGKKLMRALPPMRRVQTMDELGDFLREIGTTY